MNEIIKLAAAAIAIRKLAGKTGTPPQRFPGSKPVSPGIPAPAQTPAEMPVIDAYTRPTYPSTTSGGTVNTGANALRALYSSGLA